MKIGNNWAGEETELWGKAAPGSGSGSATYQLCDPRKKCNISEPQFLPWQRAISVLHRSAVVNIKWHDKNEEHMLLNKQLLLKNSQTETKLTHYTSRHSQLSVGSNPLREMGEATTVQGGTKKASQKRWPSTWVLSYGMIWVGRKWREISSWQEE